MRRRCSEMTDVVLERQRSELMRALFCLASHDSRRRGFFAFAPMAGRAAGT